MVWTRASVKTDGLGAEIVMGVLIDAGVVGMEIVDAEERARHLRETAAAWDYADEALLAGGDGTVCVVFYVAQGVEGEALLEGVRGRLAGLGDFVISLEGADDEDWKNEWKKHFKPMKIGRVVVVPQWEEYSAGGGEVCFWIDPGSAFGTGQHATTRLCVEVMQDVSLDGARVLDLGCGSGILGIISLLLGAGHLTAVDIDPAGAIAATRENARLNGISAEQISVFAGDALSDGAFREQLGGGYGLVLANIVADVIIPLAPIAYGLLAAGGAFICSGIIDERAGEVLLALERAGFVVADEKRDDGWVCYRCGRDA
jgi:ribosomal protein L11 methyltransferase